MILYFLASHNWLPKYDKEMVYYSMMVNNYSKQGFSLRIFRGRSSPGVAVGCSISLGLNLRFYCENNRENNVVLNKLCPGIM